MLLFRLQLIRRSRDNMTRVGRTFIVGLCLVLSLMQTNGDVNLALGRPATQSSDYSSSETGSCSANRAVDGDNNTDLQAKSCAMGDDNPDGDNWWRVDIGQPKHIKYVVVTNRGDKPAFAKRLDYFFVGITNDTSTPTIGSYVLCGQYPYKAGNGARLTVNCDPMAASGRYVIIRQQQNGQGYLTLCEVEVYAADVQKTNTWLRQRDQRLVKSSYSIAMTKRSANLCIGECAQCPGCDAVNYQEGSGRCELLPRGPIRGNLVYANGWSYWEQENKFI